MKIKRRGFGLVQVLVAAGLMGFLAMVMSQMIFNAQKGQKGVQTSLDFEVLRTSIKLALDNPSYCADSLYNKTTTARAKFRPTGVSASQRLGSVQIGTSLVARVGDPINGLIVTKLELRDTGIAPIVSGVSKTYAVEVIVEAKKSQISPGAQVFSNAGNPFRISLTTGASDEITDCGRSSANNCRIQANTSSGVHCCTGADEVVTGGVAPGDLDYRMSWIPGSPACMSFSVVGSGNPVQLRCCR